MAGGLKSGAGIDPLTLEPIEKVLTAKKAEQDQREEKTLREQAEFLNIVTSEAGARLVDLIVEKLVKRIEEMIRLDPEAAAYAKILNEIGNRENLANRAVNKLYERQYP